MKLTKGEKIWKEVLNESDLESDIDRMNDIIKGFSKQTYQMAGIPSVITKGISKRVANKINKEIFKSLK